MVQPSQTVWPLSGDYVCAVQNPRTCFVDPDLQESVAAVDRLGMPVVSSGQFAYVFKLNNPSNQESHAVRCFRGFGAERDKRYRLIDEQLDLNPLPSLASFEYDGAGIKINGRSYPVLVMEWVDGPTLDSYVDKVVGKGDVILHLADQWLKLVSTLREKRIAHGDLQHGNVIVQSGAFRLVDFDGMFVPSMKGFNAIELGHRHYQHPARDAFFFDERLDNFSAIVIYLSLIATAAKPELWAESHDENLIFKRDDFLKPSQSSLFSKVMAIGGEPKRLAEVLQKACRESPMSCPHISDLVSPKSKLPAWMTAPIGTVVQTKTREVTPSQVSTPPVRHVAIAEPPKATWQPATASVPSVPAPPIPQTVTTPAVAWNRAIGQVFGKAFGYFFVSFISQFIWVPILTAIFTGMGGAKEDSSAFAWVMAVIVCVALAVVKVRKEGLPRQFGTQPTALPQSTPTSGAHRARAPYVRQAPTSAVSGAVVVGSKIRHIYHRPTCEWAIKISMRNRITFASSTNAIARGYRRCRVCCP